MFEKVLWDMARCEPGERGKSSSRRRTCWYHHDQTTRGLSLPHGGEYGVICVIYQAVGASRTVGNGAFENNVEVQLFSVYDPFLVKAKHDGYVVIVEVLVTE